MVYSSTVCERNCARKFHASCVGASEADLCTLSKNIIWICVEYMLEFCQAREKAAELPRAHTTSSIAAVLDTLKAEVKSIKLIKLAKLSDRITEPDCLQRHSTPISTPQSSNNTSAQTNSNDRHHGCEESFSLSNIDCNVTEHEIACLACFVLSALQNSSA